MKLSQKNEKMNPKQNIHKSANSNEDSRISVDMVHAKQIERSVHVPRHTIINFESIGERLDKMESIVEKIADNLLKGK